MKALFFGLGRLVVFWVFFNFAILLFSYILWKPRNPQQREGYI